MQQRSVDQLNQNSIATLEQSIDERVIAIFNQVTPEEMKCNQNIEEFAKKIDAWITDPGNILSSEEQQHIRDNLHFCYINNNGNGAISYGRRSFSHHFIAFYRKMDGEVLILDYDINNCIGGPSTTKINASEYLLRLFYSVSDYRINADHIMKEGYNTPYGWIYDLPQFLIMNLAEFKNLYQSNAHDALIYYFEGICRGSSFKSDRFQNEFILLDNLVSQGAVFLNLSEMFHVLDTLNDKNNLLQYLRAFTHTKDPGNTRMSQMGLAYHPDHFHMENIAEFRNQLIKKSEEIDAAQEKKKSVNPPGPAENEAVKNPSSGETIEPKSINLPAPSSNATISKGLSKSSQKIQIAINDKEVVSDSDAPVESTPLVSNDKTILLPAFSVFQTGREIKPEYIETKNETNACCNIF